MANDIIAHFRFSKPGQMAVHRIIPGLRAYSEEAGRAKEEN
jgi:hypothetical protein